MVMARAGQLIFGTMRMTEERQSAAEWQALIAYGRERGIAGFHSSDEYEGFPLFCELLKKTVTAGDDIRHVVKLAEPSFDDAAFDAGRLGSRIDAYRQAFGIDRIADVQWMWRRDLRDEPRRLAEIADTQARTSDAFAAFRERGIVGRFLCFPYSIGAAELAVDAGGLDGLVVYRNLQERDFDPLLDRCVESGLSALAIRPFFAGATLEQSVLSARAQFDFVLSHPAVEAAIVSCSSQAHLDELIDD
jgi:aryl-alcohol dehydrogenase-like predicted oxidoreductase